MVNLLSVEGDEIPDFQGIRLDWMRLQVSLLLL